MSDLTLVIGNKNYSVLVAASLDAPEAPRCRVHREACSSLDTPTFKEDVAKFGPSGRVPVLKHGDITVWDSLAICEYIAELAGKGWPTDPKARAYARSVCAEMHSGFANLRSEWPFNARARNRRPAFTPNLEADVDRIDEIWIDCRRQFGELQGRALAVRRIQRGGRDVRAGGPAVQHLPRPDLGHGALVHGHGARRSGAAGLGAGRAERALDDCRAPKWAEARCRTRPAASFATGRCVARNSRPLPVCGTSSSCTPSSAAHSGS